MGSKNMTIQRAREILGTEIVGLSDQEVINLIYSTGQFADTLLDIIVDTQSGTKGTLTTSYGNNNNGTASGTMAYNEFSGTITL